MPSKQRDFAPNGLELRIRQWSGNDWPDEGYCGTKPVVRLRPSFSQGENASVWAGRYQRETDGSLHAGSAQQADASHCVSRRTAGTVLHRCNPKFPQMTVERGRWPGRRTYSERENLCANVGKRDHMDTRPKACARPACRKVN